MNSQNTSAEAGKYPLRVSFNLLMLGWTAIIAGILIWSYQSIYSEVYFLAQREAYKGYEKDVMFRYWASVHGGVYVPISQTTVPNQYLSNIPERDIRTPSQKILTLMNPAYITRQVHELSYLKSGVRGHITSLNPIRPENSPDSWERQALLAFENGVKEYSGFDDLVNEKYFRYMAPLITEKSCLKCHASQGYKVGDIRGGISSSVPWKYYEASINSQFKSDFVGYAVIWIIGFIGISVVRRKFILYIEKRDQYESGINKLNMELMASKKIIEENLVRKNQLVEELTETKNKLEKTNSEKDKFFSIIAHDLKSPFTGFIGMTEMIAEETDTFSQDELKKYNREISDSARNLFKLLQNLLDWAQMQKGGIGYDPEKIEIAEAVAQNIELMKSRASQKGVELISEVPSGKKVYADKAMLQSVLRNLISNAVKFTKRGNIVKISYSAAESNFARIEVSDTGIGMSETLLKDLFKVSIKVGRQGTDGEKSTGLGLLLCKEFVEKHGGRIWAESEEGKGSTFFFTLPEKNV